MINRGVQSAWVDWSVVDLTEFRTKFPKFRHLEMAAIELVITGLHEKPGQKFDVPVVKDNFSSEKNRSTAYNLMQEDADMRSNLTKWWSDKKRQIKS